MPRRTQLSYLYLIDHVLGENSFLKKAIVQFRRVQATDEICPVALENFLVRFLHSIQGTSVNGTEKNMESLASYFCYYAVKRYPKIIPSLVKLQ